jgi:WD repeat-containing protein 81
VNLNPTGLIRCLAVSPSGLWVATGQSSGCITVLDSRTGLVISTWKAHESEVLQLVAADNSTLISSSLDQTIGVWNVHDGKFKFHLRLVHLSRFHRCHRH